MLKRKVRFDDILDNMEAYIPKLDSALIHKAYAVAAQKHDGQVRKSGEPYLNHPIEVAYIITQMELDTTSVMAGLLHDIVEDTDATLEEITELFGRDVAHIVDGVTKLGKLTYSSREDRQAESFRKMLLAVVDDIRVLLVKLADRLNNIRTLDFLDENSRDRIAKETMDIYVPLADRLGIGKIKDELEETAFRHLFPEEHRKIVDGIKKKKRTDEKFIRKIEATLRKTVTMGKIDAEITGRVKGHYSIFKKMRSKGVSLDEVYDYIAFRILTNSTEDCYRVLGAIHSEWNPIPGRFRDWIAMPKPNGYKSVHTSLMTKEGQPFEVQIRTRQMHKTAEEGIAAHWKYKEGRTGSDDDEVYQWLRQLVEWQKEVDDPGEFMDSVKKDLFAESVFAFTPGGDIKSFIRGATPIDFAYKVHTEVGNRCVGAKVNGKLVPINTELRNGDIVEIVTSKTQRPSRDWLNIAKTTAAKSKIKKFVLEEEDKRAVELGREAVEKELRKKGMGLKADFEKNKGLKAVLDELSISKAEDLYKHIGYGKFTAKTIIRKIIGEDEVTKEGFIQKVIKKAKHTSDKVIVSGFDDLLVKISGCCRPLPGEEIIGFVTQGRGVSVHAANCPNVRKGLYQQEREIDVEWGKQANMYPVRLVIYVENRKGLLAGISGEVTNMNVDITNLKAESHPDGRGVIDIIVEVSSITHLKQLMTSIGKLDGVLDIYRKQSV